MLRNDDEDISSEGNSDEDTTEEDDSESGSGDDAQLEDDMEGVHLSSTGLERVRKALEDCPWIERGDSHYQTPLNPPEGAFPKVDRFFDAFSLILLQLPNLQSIELFFKGGDTSVICRDAKGRPAYLASTENNEDDDDLVEQARAWAASDDAVAWNLDL